jgi:hypothetical protein
MTEATIPMQTQTTIACSGCGAALAADQHYCLHCGAAQAEPRVAYRELIPPAVAEATVASRQPQSVPPAPAAVLPPRDWTPVLALGGLAALGLVLAVGILIGRSGIERTPAAAPAPQVIKLDAAAPAADAGSSDDGGGAAETDGAQVRGRRADRALARKAQRDKQVLQDLESTSGADYQRKSARLPDTVALPGDPPPKDNKAAGGGSDAETIG